ncbi:MAG TPA: polymer-forming cytoskeletal protein [Acidimicrobiales bacterium]|nr:polymer-forming cytoskeletal protein [Acidimicrobiales bacterium]
MLLNNVRSALARGALLGTTVVVTLLALAAPASAQAAPDSDDQVVLTGRAEVRAGERADAVVILDGPAVIDGDVEGPVVALNGDIRVSGSVTEDVVALNGRATITGGARVGGDVVSSRAPQVDPGATVEGETRTVRFSLRGLGLLFWVAWWVAVTISLLIVGIVLLALAPAAMAAAYAVARREPGRAIGWGLLVAVGLPVLSILVMFTVVGIPLGVIALLSLALLYAMGYVVAALALGRTMVKEPTSRYLAFLAGLVILRVVGLIPVIGGLVTFLASAYGVGALAIAGRRAGRRPTPIGAGTASP